MAKSVFTDQYERFRRALVEARNAAKLTQIGLAQKLERPQSFISKYERGERRLDVVEFLEIARVLGVPPNDILKKMEVAERKKGRHQP